MFIADVSSTMASIGIIGYQFVFLVCCFFVAYGFTQMDKDPEKAGKILLGAGGAALSVMIVSEMFEKTNLGQAVIKF